MRSAVRLIVPVVFEDRVTNGDTFITNVGPRIVAGRRDQLSDNILAFVAEGTTKRVVRTSTFHSESPKNKDLHFIWVDGSLSTSIISANPENRSLENEVFP